VKTILFVCVHNACRSQMAEAFLNRLAADRGLNLRGESAGASPGERISPVAAQTMAEAGVSMQGHRPRLLTSEAALEAGRIITMGCGVEAEMCPPGAYNSKDWGLPDPHGHGIEAVREVRNAVRARVEGQGAELATGPGAAGR